MADQTQEEYQAAYDAEMQRLEAGDPEPEKVEDEPITEQVEETEPEQVEEPNEIETIKAQMAKMEKALKDTQAWGTKSAQELSRMRKEQEEQERARNRPDLLDSVPGLEAAIEYVNPRQRETKANPQEVWLDTVSKALPDIDTVLADDVFRAKVEAVRSELGSEWDNPVVAIRELSKARQEHMVEKALSAARKDFEDKSKKLSRMQVPGGSGKPAPVKTEEAEIKRYATMSAEDVAKERARISGMG